MPELYNTVFYVYTINFYLIIVGNERKIIKSRIISPTDIYQSI